LQATDRRFPSIATPGLCGRLTPRSIRIGYGRPSVRASVPGMSGIGSDGGVVMVGTAERCPGRGSAESQDQFLEPRLSRAQPAASEASRIGIGEPVDERPEKRRVHEHQHGS